MRLKDKLHIITEMKTRKMIYGEISVLGTVIIVLGAVGITIVSMITLTIDK